MKTLRPYQEAGVRRYDGCSGAFFSMQMRLGKTLTCIRWLESQIPTPRSKLVVAPKTVLIAWELELADEGLEFFSLIDQTLSDRRCVMAHPRPIYYLVNYETISRLDPKKDRDILCNFDAVILDESTKIKNPTSKATKFLLKCCSRIPYRVCLTGLPNPEGWADIWPQMAFANGGTWMGFDNFYEWRSVYLHQYGYDWTLSPKNEAIIKKKFNEDAYVMTRKQAGIRDEKIRQRRVGGLLPAQEKAYAHILEHWELPGESSSGVIKDTKYAMVVVSWLRRLTGGTLATNPLTFMDSWKFAELLSIVTEEMPNDQLVVWFAFNADLARSYKLLKENGVSCTWITGEVDQDQRRERVAGFNSGRYRVFLCQQACGQYGIDLGSADTAIYFSTHYSYELRAQSEERIYRVGKQNDNLIIDLVTEGTVDEDCLSSIKEKRTDASLLLSKYTVPGSAQFLGKR